ncbi:MAG: hypothetical protein KGJ62_14005 [Armatimonadetes bacterium]|nr:hypothetical protein [Armatimonadota bacterium]MDE2206801.1 hypothetical protein [Armatimonadota bacterium]
MRTRPAAQAGIPLTRDVAALPLGQISNPSRRDQLFERTHFTSLVAQAAITARKMERFAAGA